MGQWQKALDISTSPPYEWNIFEFLRGLKSRNAFLTCIFKTEGPKIFLGPLERRLHPLGVRTRDLKTLWNIYARANPTYHVRSWTEWQADDLQVWPLLLSSL